MHSRGDLAENIAFWTAAAVAVVGAGILASQPPLVALGAVGAVVLVVAATVYPKAFSIYGLPLLMLVPPTVRIPAPGLPDLTPLRIGIALAIAGWFLHTQALGKMRRAFPPLPASVTYAAGAFTIYVLAISITGDAGEVSRGVSYSIEALFPAWLIWRSIDCRRDLVRAVDWLLVVMAVAAAVALWEWVSQAFVIPAQEPYFFHAPDRGGGIRVQGIFPHPLVLGAALSIVTPIAVVRALTTRGTQRLLTCIALGVFAAALLFTSSRGPWMATLAAVLFIAAVLRYQRAAILGALVVGLTMVAFSPLGGGAAELVRGLVDPDSGQAAGAFTVEYRHELWKAVADYSVDHPFGVGAGQSDEVQFIAYVGGSATDLALSIDNAFAKYALEIGWVGLLLLLVLLGAIIRATWEARRLADRELAPIAVAVVAGQLAMVVASFTVATFSWAQLSLLFWALSGLGLAVRSVGLLDERPDLGSEVVEAAGVGRPVS